MHNIACAAVLCGVWPVFCHPIKLERANPEGLGWGHVLKKKKEKKKSKGDYCSSVQLKQGFLRPWITQQCQHGPLT